MRCEHKKEENRDFLFGFMRDTWMKYVRDLVRKDEVLGANVGQGEDEDKGLI
jgi:hypothetical protein